ncbi:MAG: TonB C-terminal domain-containing protein [Gemmatimonadetes bacterium]|nr:TonB C-terminal domain-containing protein [Gemmatimonadota bacterium]
MTAARPLPASLKVPIVSSAVLHLLVVAAIIIRGAAAPPVLPPMYRVNLVAAPAGPRSEGVVTQRPATETPTAAPAAPEKAGPAPAKAVTKRAQSPSKAATPNITKTTKAVQTKSPPKAGGGPEGGTGSDVANVNTVGIEFPFPGYLTNIVRQITLQFDIPQNAASLKAEVTFLIHRDGSVTGLRLITNSGSYVFDQSALGAVEAAGTNGRFGPLPQAFSDDVLPIIFSFDPKRMR